MSKISVVIEGETVKKKEKKIEYIDWWTGLPDEEKDKLLSSLRPCMNEWLKKPVKTRLLISYGVLLAVMLVSAAGISSGSLIKGAFSLFGMLFVWFIFSFTEKAVKAGYDPLMALVIAAFRNSSEKELQAQQRHEKAQGGS